MVFHATFADEKSQKSPLVKTLNAGHFFWAGVLMMIEVKLLRWSISVYGERP